MPDKFPVAELKLAQPGILTIEKVSVSPSGSDAVGVNARDLTSFEVDVTRVVELLPEAGDGVLRVAESGLRTGADVARVAAAGADAVLVGETLMRAADPRAAPAALKEAAP